MRHQNRVAHSLVSLWMLLTATPLYAELVRVTPLDAGDNGTQMLCLGMTAGDFVTAELEAEYLSMRPGTTPTNVRRIMIRPEGEHAVLFDIASQHLQQKLNTEALSYARPGMDITELWEAHEVHDPKFDTLVFSDESGDTTLYFIMNSVPFAVFCGAGGNCAYLVIEVRNGKPFEVVPGGFYTGFGVCATEMVEGVQTFYTHGTGGDVLLSVTKLEWRP